MALPKERQMPVVEARFVELRRQWLVKLPGGLELPAADTADVEALVRRFAYGASIRYLRTAGA